MSSYYVSSFYVNNGFVGSPLIVTEKKQYHGEVWWSITEQWEQALAINHWYWWSLAQQEDWVIGGPFSGKFFFA